MLNRLNRFPPSLFLVFFTLLFVAAMISNPKIVYDGALTGLNTWWVYVFPSLLPFFIAAEMLMRLGFVQFLGIFLEPVMRPLFNVPGSGAFVMVVGFTSGFPIGSMVTASLRHQGHCTREEGERLMCFTNNSSPLFMLTAVSAGMFGKPELGIIIAGAHYLANIILGLGLGIYSRIRKKTSTNPNAKSRLLREALRFFINFQREHKTPLGKLLGEAVASSVTKLINIGGFVILFSVLIHLFRAFGLLSVLSTLLEALLGYIGFSKDMLIAISGGFFEMTTGTKMASAASGSELEKLMAIGLILGWSGLSIHAQVAAMIAHTDLRMRLFIISRFIHAALAACLTWCLYHIFGANLTHPVTVGSAALPAYHSWSVLGYSFAAMLWALLFLICLGVLLSIISSLIKVLRNGIKKPPLY